MERTLGRNNDQNGIDRHPGDRGQRERSGIEHHAKYVGGIGDKEYLITVSSAVRITDRSSARAAWFVLNDDRSMYDLCLLHGLGKSSSNDFTAPSSRGGNHDLHL